MVQAEGMMLPLLRYLAKPFINISLNTETMLLLLHSCWGFLVPGSSSSTEEEEAVTSLDGCSNSRIKRELLVVAVAVETRVLDKFN